MAANGGASRTIASVMPVSAWMAGGIGTPGFTSVDHSDDGRRAAGRVGVDADDADFGDRVARGRRAGGLEVDEGEGGGKELHGRRGADEGA